MSLAYGEQGKYSRTVESPNAVLKAPAQIKVQFVDVTKEAGLAVTAPFGEAQFFHGPGACFLDYDNDGYSDLVVSSDPVSYTHLDVYKRQVVDFVLSAHVRPAAPLSRRHHSIRNSLHP